MFVEWFPAYRLLESALTASRRECEDLRTDLAIARATVSEAQKRSAEDRDELKELRDRYEKSLIDTANFMSWAKAGKKVFPDDSEQSLIPQEPVDLSKFSRPQAADLVAQATREFRKEVNRIAQENAA